MLLLWLLRNHPTCFQTVSLDDAFHSLGSTDEKQPKSKYPKRPSRHNLNKDLSTCKPTTTSHSHAEFSPPDVLSLSFPSPGITPSPITNIPLQVTPGPESTATRRTPVASTPWVELIEQPKQQGQRSRFRYKGRPCVEIVGEKSCEAKKTFPTIKVKRRRN